MERIDTNLILNNVYSDGVLNTRIDTNVILNAVYSEEDNVIRVNVANLPSGGGLPFYRETVTVVGSLAATASYSGTPAGCASLITIVADVAGAAGNIISFSFDGAATIDDMIGLWNAANPANTCTRTSLPATGGQRPNNKEKITLSNGADAGQAPAYLDITHNLDATMIRVSVYHVDILNKIVSYYLTTAAVTDVKDNTGTCGYKYTEALPNSVRIYLSGNFTIGLDYTFIIEKLY